MYEAWLALPMIDEADLFSITTTTTCANDGTTAD